ncbi:MAG: sugar ABC transporter substrate-binding protein [Pleurocapsa minor GSE-CHR-MK-17-07R]|jgi:multiple sugar transport system substrate-binding protein|nr:sugar ABC transporter substrate-binding protein [Pleurocapsa minor GSE-CHR-MK 17-07R]
MNKKLAFGVLAASLMAVPSVAFVSAQDEVTLTWRTRPDNQAEIDVYTAISADVDARLEGVTLQYQAGGTETDGYQNTLITEFAAGTAPDVFWIPGSDLARFVSEGTVLNLADLAAADANFDGSVFYPQQMEQLMFNPEDGSMEGALWGLPRDASAMALYYNQDLFDAAGVDNPTVQLENGEWNWDTFLETSAAISELGDETYGFGMSNWWGNWELFVNAAGGSYFNADRTACALNSPEVENALTFMRSLYEQEVAVPYGSDVEAPFVAGSVGMFLNGRWATPNLLAQATFNWDVAEVPAGPAGQSNFLFWGAYVVNANTANPEAAWQLMQELTSADVQSQVASLGANFPSRIGEEVLAGVAAEFPELNNAAFTNAMANYAVPEAPLWAGDFGAINWAEGGVESRITAVLSGAEAPADFVATICDVVNAGF